MVLIAFGYEARSGKDLASSYLVEKYDFKKIAFADPLKEAAKCIYGFTDEQVYGNLKEVIDTFWQETPRVILQKMGTECMRHGHRDDIWIQAAKKRILENKSVKHWVISDCRFPNEAAMIKSLGGCVVRIDADYPGRQQIKTNFHKSEIAMVEYKDWDYVVENNSTVEAYNSKIDSLFWGIIKDTDNKIEMNR